MSVNNQIQYVAPNENYRCPICLDESPANEKGRKWIALHPGDGLKHPFHEQCIQKAAEAFLGSASSPKLEKDFPCPTCKKDIGVDSAILSKSFKIKNSVFRLLGHTAALPSLFGIPYALVGSKLGACITSAVIVGNAIRRVRNPQDGINDQKRDAAFGLYKRAADIGGLMLGTGLTAWIGGQQLATEVGLLYTLFHTLEVTDLTFMRTQGFRAFASLGVAGAFTASCLYHMYNGGVEGWSVTSALAGIGAMFVANQVVNKVIEKIGHTPNANRVKIGLHVMMALAGSYSILSSAKSPAEEGGLLAAAKTAVFVGSALLGSLGAIALTQKLF